MEQAVTETSGEAEGAPAGKAAPAAGGSVRKTGRKLTSNLEAPKNLKEYWYPIQFSKDLLPGAFVQVSSPASERARTQGLSKRSSSTRAPGCRSLENWIGYQYSLRFLGASRLDVSLRPVFRTEPPAA